MVFAILISQVASFAILGSTNPGLHSRARVSHFSMLAFRESPYADILGVVPLTEAQAAQRHHYEFVHDAQGRITEVSFRLGSELRPTNHTANYLFRAPRVKIDYDKNKEIRKFYNEQGNRISVAGGVYEERFDRDKYGYRTRLRFYDQSGKLTESNWGIASYHWITLSDGTVKEARKSLNGEHVDLRPGFAFRQIQLHYDERGLLAVMRNINRDGLPRENDSGAAQDKIEYDDRGCLLGWNVLDAHGNPECGNGQNVARGILTTNEFGYEDLIRYEDEAGLPIQNAHGFGQSRSKYDRFGNMVSRRFFDEHGKDMLFNGYNSYRYKWSGDGRRLESFSMFDKDGNLTTHSRKGYAQMVMKYDEQENHIGTTYLDTTGQTVQRKK